MIRFVAQHFTTIKAEAISEESLRSKYYNLEPGAVASVKDKIKDFMRILNDL